MSARPSVRTWRPFGARMAAIVFGGALFATFVGAWIGFGPQIQARFTVLQRGTLLGFGIAVALIFYALGRSRVTAGDQLVVVNGLRRRDLDWPFVVAIRMPHGAPWATLDLADGTAVPVMALQGSDGSRARAALAEIRTVIEQHSADETDPPGD